MPKLFIYLHGSYNDDNVVIMMMTMQAEDYFEDEEDYDFWGDYSADYIYEQNHTNRVSSLSSSMSMLASSLSSLNRPR